MENQKVPSYKEIIKEVKNHLNERKGLLLKRTLLVAWPGLVLVVIYSLFGSVESLQETFVYLPLKIL